MDKKICFEIAGGKYEPDGEVNYKYIDSTDSAEKALRMYAGVEGYPFSYLRLIISEDGAQSTFTLLGDKTDVEYADMCARTGLLRLWMLVTGASIVDIDITPEEQLAVVQAFVKGVRS